MFDEDLDATIDEVAREMTRGELPPDFRARVIARLESRRGRLWSWRRGWVLLPLAVAAAVLLAVLVVRAPWRSDGRVASEVGHDAGGEVRVKLAPFVAQDSSPARPERIASTRVTSVVPSYVASGLSRTTERSVASDLTPAPIAIESLDVEAMESLEVAPLSVDAMESIDVATLDVAPLELPVIGEQ